MRAQSSNLTGLALASQCFAAAALAGDTDIKLPALPLPPLADARNGLTPELLKAMAGLYYLAELEHASITAMAEALVMQRARLGVRSFDLSRRLEDFERRELGWYTRPQRQALFARLFGSSDGRDANFDFERLFANFCMGMVQAAPLQGAQRTPRRFEITPQARLRRAGADLLFNLSAHRYGNLPLAGQIMMAQTRLAMDIVGHPDLSGLLGVRGFWANLRALLGTEAPDLGRIVARAQTGLHLLQWLSGKLAAFFESSPTSYLAPDSDALTWATQWLKASGFSLNWEDLYTR